MKNELIKNINGIIEILKTNPKIEIVYEGKELGPCEIGFEYPNYPAWVYTVERLFQPLNNYQDIVDNIKKKNKSVEEYNIVEIRAALTYFVRGERICDGHMASCIEGGYLLKWLSRYKELLLEESNNDKKRI